MVQRDETLAFTPVACTDFLRTHQRAGKLSHSFSARLPALHVKHGSPLFYNGIHITFAWNRHVSRLVNPREFLFTCRGDSSAQAYKRKKRAKAVKAAKGSREDYIKAAKGPREDYKPPKTRPSATFDVEKGKSMNMDDFPPEILLAAGIGAGTGFGVVLFNYAIRLVHSLMVEDVMGQIMRFGPWTLAVVPTLGGVVVGGLRFVWKDFGPNISTLFVGRGGNIKELVPVSIKPVAKAVAAAVTLGTGNSLGPEGPSVEIGANVGLMFGRILQVSPDRQSVLLGAGAAAGIAAGFNAPIAGVFFALEVVMASVFETSAASVILLAAVVAALIAQIGLGESPAFILPQYQIRNIAFELPLYSLLGFLATAVSVLANELIKFTRAAFDGKVPRLELLGSIPKYVQPVLGGLSVGVVALWYPQIMFNGYETISAILQNKEFAPDLLLTLVAVKMVMTAVCLGSGLVGGLFAPSLFLGASLGSAFEKLVLVALGDGVLSTQIAEAPAYAMVGMAATLAGVAGAPLTSIILLFELTRSYDIVLPLMAAVGLGSILSRLTRRLAGLDLRQMQMETTALVRSESDSYAGILVGDVMDDVEQVLFLPADTSVARAAMVMTDKKTPCIIVTDGRPEGSRDSKSSPSNGIRGILTLQDVRRVIAIEQEAIQASTLALSLRDALDRTKIGDVCSTTLIVAYPDEPVGDAMRRMQLREIRQMPVLARAMSSKDAPHVIGLLVRDTVRIACAITATRQEIQNSSAPPAAAELPSQPTWRARLPDPAQEPEGKPGSESESEAEPELDSVPPSADSKATPTFLSKSKKISSTEDADVNGDWSAGEGEGNWGAPAAPVEVGADTVANGSGEAKARSEMGA